MRNSKKNLPLGVMQQVMQYIGKTTRSARDSANQMLVSNSNTDYNSLRGLLVIFAISLLSFSCNGQNCDTIVVEDPAQQKAIISLQEDILVLKDDLKTVQAIVTEQNAKIGTQETKINNQAFQITTLTNTITSKNKTISELELALLKVPDTIYETIVETVHDTIKVESDFITVEGVEYKVVDIELILPRQSKDTLTIETCFTDNKVWFHAGDPGIYPHVIYFPSKELSMVGVMFNDSLTIDMKKYQTKFKIERTKDHSNATTTYRNLFVDPSTYMP